MAGANVEFVVPELSVTDLPTDVSGLFFHEAVKPTLTDMSHNIEVEVEKDRMNQIFLFFSDDTSGNTTADDLSDMSSTDLKYLVNVNQWNVKVETKKVERKYVIANLLMDLFGGGATDALANVDVFSNEAQLDSDISNIFHQRLHVAQQETLKNGDHGAVELSGSLASGVDQPNFASKFAAALTTNPGAITAKLLEQAAIFTREAGNSSSEVLKRQFGTSNDSGANYGLPAGWRTFQFIDGDSLAFNLIVKQPDDFYPAWSVNPTAAAGSGGLVTSYRVKFVVRDSPTSTEGGFGTFTEPL